MSETTKGDLSIWDKVPMPEAGGEQPNDRHA
jgi:hypothetical protein